MSIKESANPERRDRKKLKSLLKKIQTPENVTKIKILRAKIAVYESRKKKPQPKKKVPEDDLLEAAFQENKDYWKKERPRQEEEAQRQEERQRQRRRQKVEYERQRREQEEEDERQRQEQKEEDERARWYRKVVLENNDLKEIQKTMVVPEDIIHFMNQSFDKDVYRKLMIKYHPDKQKYSTDVCTQLSQLITSHKPPA